MYKIAVITGSASGIGERIAQGLLKENCIVIGLDIKYHISDTKITKLKYSEVNELHCDVSSEENVADVVSAIVAACGKIDYLINVAGVISKNRCMAIDELTVEEWNYVMSINLTGTFLVCRYSLPYLCENGCIVNFSTEQVEKPNLKSAPYAVSKAGIEMLTRILALEHTKRHIRANTVALGSVRTNFIRHMVDSERDLEAKMKKANENMPFGIIETEDVWLLVKYILFDGKKMTGQTILLESGMTQ